MTRHDVVWGVWSAAALGSFLALELPAVRRDDQEATFSAFTRRRLGIEPRRRGYRFTEMAFLAAHLWAMAHILDRHLESK